MPVSTPTGTSVILRLVWFLQTELFHIIGTNWGNGEIILVPEHSYFLLPTSPLGIERQQCSQSLSVSLQQKGGAWACRRCAQPASGQLRLENRLWPPSFFAPWGCRLLHCRWAVLLCCFLVGIWESLLLFSRLTTRNLLIFAKTTSRWRQTFMRTYSTLIICIVCQCL